MIIITAREDGGSIGTAADNFIVAHLAYECIIKAPDNQAEV